MTAYEACITAAKAGQFAQFPASDYAETQGGSKWADHAKQDLRNIRAGVPSTVLEKQLQQPIDDKPASTEEQPE